MTTVELARAQTTIQGCIRRRNQQLRWQGHGGCRRLGDVLTAWIEQSGLLRQARQGGEVAETFSAAIKSVAPRLAGRIDFLAYRQGRLYLDCSSAAAQAELLGFHRERLLAAMRDRLPAYAFAAIVARPRPTTAKSPRRQEKLPAEHAEHTESIPD